MSNDELYAVHLQQKAAAKETGNDEHQRHELHYPAGSLSAHSRQREKFS